jgi:hypothetical protein
MYISNQTIANFYATTITMKLQSKSIFLFFPAIGIMPYSKIFPATSLLPYKGTTRAQRSNDGGCPFQGYQRARVPQGTYRRFVQIAHSAPQQHHHFLEICVTAHADRSGILTRRGGENSILGLFIMYSCQGCGGTCLRRRVTQVGLEVPFSSLLVKFVETVAIGLFDRSRLPLARGLVVTIRRTNWQGWLSTR